MSARCIWRVCYHWQWLTVVSLRHASQLRHDVIRCCCLQFSQNWWLDCVDLVFLSTLFQLRQLQQISTQTRRCSPSCRCHVTVDVGVNQTDTGWIHGWNFKLCVCVHMDVRWSRNISFLYIVVRFRTCFFWQTNGEGRQNFRDVQSYTVVTSSSQSLSKEILSNFRVFFYVFIGIIN